MDSNGLPESQQMQDVLLWISCVLYVYADPRYGTLFYHGTIGDCLIEVVPENESTLNVWIDRQRVKDVMV